MAQVRMQWQGRSACGAAMLWIRSQAQNTPSDPNTNTTCTPTDTTSQHGYCPTTHPQYCGDHCQPLTSLYTKGTTVVLLRWALSRLFASDFVLLVVWPVSGILGGGALSAPQLFGHFGRPNPQFTM